MSPHNEATLCMLLRKALDSATITLGDSNGISLGLYREIVQTYRAEHDLDLHFEAFSYDIRVNDIAVRENICTLLRDELNDFLHEDATYSAISSAGGRPQTTVDDILKNLMKATIVEGPDAAARSLYIEVDNGIAFQTYFLLTGINVDTEMQILDGISLLPLSHSNAYFLGRLPDIYGITSMDLLSKTLLRMDMLASPLLCKPIEGHPIDSEGHSYFARTVRSSDVTNFHINAFLQALTMTGEQPIQWVLSWPYVADEHIFNLGPLGGSSYWKGSSYWSGEISNAPATLFTETQVREGVNIYMKLISLPQDVQQGLQIPIDRWMKSMTQQNPVNKMIDLGIALESLYLGGISEELAFRFRLRASLYLGDVLERRTQLNEEFKEIYNQRSKAVHQGQTAQASQGFSTEHSDQRIYQEVSTTLPRVTAEGYRQW